MKKHLTVGIAGHIDHGKTSLVRCLTGIDTDRLRLEKERGLSIETGIAPFSVDNKTTIALVDVPGHVDFIKNTIRGLCAVDMTILVVAADDGIMPQTLEHLEILRFQDVKYGFVVISKADLVDDETLDLAELEIIDEVQGTFLEGRPVIPFSAVNGKGLKQIIEAIKNESKKIKGKDPDSYFRLWIDQIKGFQGFGTVVSGTIYSGTVRQDDLVSILPTGKTARVRSIESHHDKITHAFAGQRVGINLNRISLGDVARGMSLVFPESINPSYLINAELRIPKDFNAYIKDRQRVKLYIGTSVTNCLLVLIETEKIIPGEQGLVQFRLLKPVAALPGDPYVITLLNRPTVIGGGTVLELPNMKFRKSRQDKMIPYLKALKEKNPRGFVCNYTKAFTDAPVTVADLSKISGISIDVLQNQASLLKKEGKIVMLEGEYLFDAEKYISLKKKIPEVIQYELEKDLLKNGLKIREIQEIMQPKLDSLILENLFKELIQEGRLIKDKGNYGLKGYRATLSEEQAVIMELCMDYAVKSGFSPFSADTIWKVHKKRLDKREIQKMLEYLRLKGMLIILNDKRFILPEIMTKISETVENVIKQRGSFELADLKENFGYGRTVGIPILEYLDTIGLTRRVGNKRLLMGT